MNIHGGSIGWLNKDGTKSYKKGIKAKEISKIIKKQLIPKGITTAIIHFRIASVGGVKRNLNHPFEISSRVELNMENYNTTKDLLFHNGTWDEYAEVLVDYLKSSKKPQFIPRGNYSDSRIMAYLAYKMGTKQMAKQVTGWNKVAVITSKGIIKYGAGWCNIEGNQCSNDYFIPKQMFNNNYYTYNDTFQSEVGNTDALGYLNSDELIEMTNIIDIYGVNESEIADMMEDGTSIYDIGDRLEREDQRMMSMNYEDEINYLNDGDKGMSTN
jgi:predicted glutamine amidotransferase